MLHETSTDEIVARKVAGETLSDLRTVKKEMRARLCSRRRRRAYPGRAFAASRSDSSNPTPPRAA
jgi:hypothetical protein